ncbi:hypothetical protein [Pedobacter sp. SYSU D00535]|uniref:tetratricopeptide repeat protein n=1 Tax=Pedobacter sp. SYSU D00535 TaxID=2810308 RepID=UPI001A95E9A3|nr:hypothetical protein [Pedobacter sp. SYSU D00535]
MKVFKIALKAGVVAGLMSSSAFAQSLADAKKAIDAEQFQQAKTTLKRLIAAQPGNAENYYFLGRVYLHDEYVDSAKTTFSKGVSANEKEALNYIGLGSVDLLSKNAAAAKSNFDKAIGLASRKDNDPYIYVAKAYISAPKPDYEAAVPLLEKAKSMDEKDAEVYLALGDAYRGLKRNSDAYSAYRTAFDLDKNMLRAKVELGVINKLAKAFEQSATDFNSVVASSPNYAPAYRELAETYLQWSFGAPSPDKENRLKLALDNYKKYLDLTDRSLESRMRFADFLVYASDWKTLEQEAQAMSTQADANPRIYRYLAISAFENGNYAGSIKAMKDFMAKVEADRLIPLDHLYLGKAQFRAGDPAAFENLSKAVELDSTFAEEMRTWAAAAFKEKKYGEAGQLYELAIKSPKATLQDRFNIGFSYYWDYATRLNANEKPEKSNLVKADSAFAYVARYAPNVSDAPLFRARINKILDDDKNPKGLMVPHYEQFIKVVSEKPENLTDARYKKALAEAYNNLGAFHLKSNPAKAKEYFGKSLSVDPSNSYASDVLKQLGGGK